MSAQRCIHTKRNGQPCGGFALAGSRFCFAHDPQQATKRDEARRRGGKAGRVLTLSAADTSVRSLGDVVTLIEDTINDVRNGRMDSRTANTIGYLANISIKAIEQSELEVRLEALEAVLEPERGEAVSWRRGA